MGSNERSKILTARIMALASPYSLCRAEGMCELLGEMNLEIYGEGVTRGKAS